jgi:hypothetical protein
MQPLSEAPKIIRMVKKFKVDDSVDMDPKAVQDRVRLFCVFFGSR